MSVFKKRVTKFADNMKAKGIDASILFNQGHIRYFTNFRVNQAAETVLIIGNDASICFLVPRLDLLRAKRDCWIDHIVTFFEDTPDYLAPLRTLIQKEWKTIGIEKNTISVHHLSYISKMCKGKMEEIDSLLANQMKIKTDWEIGKLKEAAHIASLTMDEVKRYITLNQGITEREATGYAKYMMEKSGAENYSFEPFMMSGLDAALPRRVSTEKVLTEGELILFDMGCIYEGYCSDITRTFSLGKLSIKQKEIFDIALKAQEKAIKAIKPGVRSHEIDAVARDFITENGYGDYFPHLTGHGLGMFVHEHPILDQGEESMLEKNMVLTVEPGIYVPGIGAARIEDMIVVTEDGYEYLTTSSRDLLLT